MANNLSKYKDLIWSGFFVAVVLAALQYLQLVYIFGNTELIFVPVVSAIIVFALFRSVFSLSTVMLAVFSLLVATSRILIGLVQYYTTGGGYRLDSGVYLVLFASIQAAICFGGLYIAQKIIPKKFMKA